MNWIEQFPGLSSPGDAEKQLLTEQGSVIEVPEDTVVFGPGKTPEHLLFFARGHRSRAANL